jgi:tetratricopeptide (TPR) repeat protein
MNNNLETIENYVTGQLSADERWQFETALRTDSALADELAFYLLTKQVATSQAREQRKAELDALRDQSIQPPRELAEIETRTRPLWSAPMRWAAAASIVLLLGVGWYFINPSSTDTQLVASQQVDAYIATHFNQLPTTMGSGPTGSATTDSLKTGVGLYNEGKLTEAGNVFEQVLTRQPNNASAIKFAGLVSLRQGNYDKAVSLFHQLSEQTDLAYNPGLFYESLALLKRGKPLDKENAKKLLDQVIIKNLEGKKEAKKLLSELQ